MLAKHSRHSRDSMRMLSAGDSPGALDDEIAFRPALRVDEQFRH
nr:hypothetical protein [Paraburkholderia xenovorans]